MKVAHVSASVYGGAGIAAYRLHKSLVKKELDSIFFQMPYSDPELIRTLTIHPQNTFEYRLRKKIGITAEDLNEKKIRGKSQNYEIISFPTSSYELENIPLIRDADIVNLHWVAGFINYPSFFKKIKKPIVWTLHDMNPFLGIFHYQGDTISNKDEWEQLDREIQKIKSNSIHLKEDITIVTPSDWMKNNSSSSETFGRYKHVTIPYGIDLTKFYPRLESDVRSFDNNRKTIIFISHSISIYRKGFDLFLEGLNKLSDYSFNLITVGGNKPDILSDKIIHKHFNKINSEDELCKLYSSADLTILSSREDNLPNVMLESLACGTPLISFSNGGMAEHVKDGETGILLSSIDSDSLASGLKKFFENEYHFDRQKIRAYAEQTFAEAIQAERYIQLYKSILEK